MMKNLIFSLSILSILSNACIAVHPLDELKNDLKNEPECLATAKKALDNGYNVDWSVFDFTNKEDIRRAALVLDAVDKYLGNLKAKKFKEKKELLGDEQKSANADFQKLAQYQGQLLESYSKAFLNLSN